MWNSTSVLKRAAAPSTECCLKSTTQQNKWAPIIILITERLLDQWDPIKDNTTMVIPLTTIPGTHSMSSWMEIKCADAGCMALTLICCCDYVFFNGLLQLFVCFPERWWGCLCTIKHLLSVGESVTNPTSGKYSGSFWSEVLCSW